MSLYLRDACFINWKTHAITTGHHRVDTGTVGTVEAVDAIPEYTTRCRRRAPAPSVF